MRDGRDRPEAINPEGRGTAVSSVSAASVWSTRRRFMIAYSDGPALALLYFQP
jgi:hypothetical protein